MLIVKKIKNYIFIKKNIAIGKNTRILTSISNFGSEPYLVKIGDNCTITSGVKFVTHDASIETALNFRKIPRVQGNFKIEKMGAITIGDNCMIGVNSIILPGVTIGDNCVVGAGSVVTTNIPSGSLVAGNPAKVISDIETYSDKALEKSIMIPIEKNLDKRKNHILIKVK
ncbi:DapH/DapD/GlmU-related protein [Exiguobacterium sp. s70]|uniref:acyltransferase n=1 Tax=Exiguobacterium sp. s70 TaxID=2751228 RepID=UPI001BE92C43|nr:DapH/DapD/GlmU-related protein [Exiguobacterium sp. s70]